MGESRERTWNYMSSCDTFSVVDVAIATGMNIAHCQSMITRFKNRGYIRVISGLGKCNNPFFYRIVEGAAPKFGSGNRSGALTENRPLRKKKTKQQMMWNTIRISRKFNIDDLLMTASVSDKHAYWYLIRLERAGYIKAICKVDTKLSNKAIHGEQSSYKLMRYTGPKAPIVRDDGLWDQNVKILYHFVC